MNRFSRGMLAMLAATTTLAGCESTEPEAAPSTVTARAYVDADGSGDFSTGDVPLSGVPITLQTPDGAQVAQASTGAQGTVSFPDVEPGSYLLSLGGTAPPGAVLASAAVPAVVAPFTGAEVEAEFRFAYQPGALFGFVYRDDDGNDQPSGGDTPAEGVPVDLFAGTDTSGEPLQSTTTDATGGYVFFTLRPGDYTVVFHPFPTIDVVGDTVRTVTVTANTPTQEDAQFTGSVIAPIDEVRALPQGSAVLVEGVVTAAQGTFGSRSIYVQDASGGISVFGVDSSLGLQLGDSVQLLGALGAFNEEVQIGALPGASDVTVTLLGTGTVPAPATLTGAQLNSGSYEGDLATVPNATVVSVGGGSTSTAYNVTLQDPAGTTFDLRVSGSSVGIPQTFWTVGTVYDVTGVIGQYRGTQQLKPRSLCDISSSGPQPIGCAETLPDDASVVVEGVVTVPQGVFRSDNLYVQDASGGILVFGVDSSLGIQLGDSIRVSGDLDTFFGEREIVSPTVTVLGSGTVPAPQDVTGAEVLAYQPLDGELVRADSVTVTSVGTPSSSSGSYTVDVQSPDGTAFEIRVEGNTGIGVSTWTVGEMYTVTGVVTVFSGNGQIKPRFDTDIVAL